jgi:hypothetical protein
MTKGQSSKATNGAEFKIENKKAALMRQLL